MLEQMIARVGHIFRMRGAGQELIVLQAGLAHDPRDEHRRPSPAAGGQLLAGRCLADDAPVALGQHAAARGGFAARAVRITQAGCLGWCSRRGNRLGQRHVGTAFFIGRGGRRVVGCQPTALRLVRKTATCHAIRIVTPHTHHLAPPPVPFGQGNLDHLFARRGTWARLHDFVVGQRFSLRARRRRRTTGKPEDRCDQDKRQGNAQSERIAQERAGHERGEKGWPDGETGLPTWYANAAVDPRMQWHAKSLALTRQAGCAEGCHYIRR